MDRKPFRILAVAGSLRQGSYNRGLLRAAATLAPDGVEVQFFDIGQLPFFNEDLEEAGDPQVLVPQASRIFDEHVDLRDEETSEEIGQLVEALAHWCRSVQPEELVSMQSESGS